MQHKVIRNLQVSGGYVQYRFDCGSGEGLVHVAGRRVDDGIWHALHLEHRGGSAQVAVDAHYKGSGSAPGPHDVLNLEGHELHLGGAPAVMGLVGCLDDARVGGLPLPLHLRPTGHAQLRRLANVHFSCHLVDACGSQPCLNGATCRPLLTTGYSCTCPAHFQAARCQMSTRQPRVPNFLQWSFCTMCGVAIYFKCHFKGDLHVAQTKAATKKMATTKKRDAGTSSALTVLEE
ncbi:hypothetical protein HPB51_013080 [Rhipicephalus microplus]|uniref:Uncharacterized protein n=1 Tax=Rhipicephalus microplus TaxID=6941 RepID=A0A9J6F254_RHIMP|nr:hypothetical protein HPB51_013080 [Rhipicephalus microplus]